jgi:hypothetical protein
MPTRALIRVAERWCKTRAIPESVGAFGGRVDGQRVARRPVAQINGSQEQRDRRGERTERGQRRAIRMDQ